MPRLLCLFLFGLFSQIASAAPSKVISYTSVQAVAGFTMLSLSEVPSVAPPTDDSVHNTRLRKKGKWVKWLGIGSLVSLLTPLGVLSLPAAIVAIIMGGSVKRQTDDAAILKDVRTGRTTAIAAIILQIVAFILLLALIAVLFASWR